MNIINNSVNLNAWINTKTKNSKSVVELGAGFFNRLSNIDKNISLKIGIEIWKPYIDNAKYNDCIKIQGDIKNYKKLLESYELDTVMIVDVLEHFDKEDGFKLIEDLKQNFNKIILMLPIGRYEQDKDVTGFGAHEYQTHRSYWYDEDALKLNFNENIIDLFFHKNNNGTPSSCYFGVWEKI